MEPPLAGPPKRTARRWAPSLSSLVRVSTIAPAARFPALTDVSLSSFFPVGTQYFYGYPSGEHSGFFNAVPPFIEEIVAARALSCAGAWVTPVVFASSIDPLTQEILREDLGMAPARRQPIVLTSTINETLSGPQRNRSIVRALSGILAPKKFVMAQPYMDTCLQTRFALPPALTLWLNDKVNMPRYVPPAFLPERYAECANGRAFAASPSTFPTPCVVKVSSSSSGDGVRICRTEEELRNAQREFAKVKTGIIVDEHVEAVRNFGIQFGIPSDPAQEIELIGVSEQLTTPEGAFIGGLVDPDNLFARIDGVNDLLLHHVLPAVREMGWYGIGGFDVLVDSRNRFFIVDPNFRMTGMTAFLCTARNGTVRKCMASFVGTFEGNRTDFVRAIAPLARPGARQRLHIVALTHRNGTFRMSAALLFGRDEEHEVPRLAGEFLALGLQSRALERLKRNGREHYPDLPGASV
ncbi:hypothetical protein A2412_01945 [Candidatus Peribacteria bacterium RIFOXYC1_FULL_58_8]|nr:MAG: hypothetical protein A2412_01945 [Candidatus Peribacteria bacterium RIFOXYC1_FULL_58_8]